MQPRILVVEDDPSLSDIVCSYLAMQGHQCTPAFSGTEARMLLDSAQTPFDLVLCDLMLPGILGEQLIAHLRATQPHAATPVIVISAKTQVSDRVDLLRSGADDYLVKPFPLEELLARAEVQLRRAVRLAPTAPDLSERPTLTHGRWTASPSTRTFSVDGTPIALTRTEFDIACLLMRHPGRVFSKLELLELTNSGPNLGDEKTAATHVGNLRTKLRDTGTQDYIQTVWGIGFKLQAP